MNAKVLSCKEYDLGRTERVEHGIDTEQHKPIRQGLRKIPRAQTHIIDEQVEIMMKQNIIQESNSDWASNVVLVKKKDGSWRFCVDYRGVNNKTIKDAFPLPPTNDCLDTHTGP